MIIRFPHSAERPVAPRKISASKAAGYDVAQSIIDYDVEHDIRMGTMIPAEPRCDKLPGDAQRPPVRPVTAMALATAASISCQLVRSSVISGAVV
jgi:hypothetical protein